MGIYQLIIESGQRAGQCVQPPGNAYTIGRDAGNDLRLVEDGVSGRHCELQVTRAGVMLRDCRSTNGVFVNHQRVEEARLHRGDVIELGGARLRFEYLIAVPGVHRRRTPLFWASVLLVGMTFALEFGAMGIAVWTRHHRITPEESARILKFFPPVPTDAVPDALMPGAKPAPAATAGSANPATPVPATPATPGAPGAPGTPDAAAAPVPISGNR
ncbi:MAG: FHA domain-containing protein [Verrucomicrobia bacterium]|nr:FHA domain-containing protein [Verrucomicrobiota bacterium]